MGYSSLFFGTSGVENEYDGQLTPHSQPVRTLGQLLSPPGRTTDNVTLTVRRTLQTAARQALAAIPGANKDGAVVALQPKTGAVLAMYSSPSFDPNTLAQPNVTGEELAGHFDFTEADHEGYHPGYPMATYVSLLPGSTFKVVTSAAVYDFDPKLATFDYPVQGCTTPGAIPTTTDQICNDGPTEATATACGGTMVQMLPQSCDPGYATLGLKLGATVLYKQAMDFGIDSIPPIDLNHAQDGQPGIVSRSNFPTPTDLSSGHSPGPAGVAYSAFGQQTVNETALQNAMVAEGIADTGEVMTPHVMATVRTNSQDRLIESYLPSVYRTATTPAAAQSVKKLMQGVVTTPLGTAHEVGFPAQDEVAVKTGTAQVGTSAENTIDWMIGLAPASDPTVAIAVVVPQQPTTYSGARTAGPIMLKMIEAVLAEQGMQSPSPATTTTSPGTSTPYPRAPYTAPTVPSSTTAPASSTTSTTTTTAPAGGGPVPPPVTLSTTPPPPPTTTTTTTATSGVTKTTGPGG